jgi:fructan beta-fructosidase
MKMKNVITNKFIFRFVIIVSIYCTVFGCGKPIEQTGQRTKEMIIQKQYLNLPVQNEVDRQQLHIIIDGDTVRQLETNLAIDNPDFWVFVDVGMYRGKRAVLTASTVPPGSRGFDLIYQDDRIKDEDSIYKERLRPQFHFSSRRGWNNDPHGLVYYDGEYHMTYQHSPYAWREGLKHWGNAVSEDLIHWIELPTALYPDKLGMMSSGSAVIDHHNTSGFQTGEEKVMVAAYSAYGKNGPPVQCIAYSNDRGRAWTKYDGNPVIGDRSEIVGSRNIRDPKVFWYDPTKNWVMVLFEGVGHSIFTSDNLKEWRYESHIDDFWECPELFELAVDGDPDNKKWVMYGASGTYMIGNFDGKQFNMESGKHSYCTGKSRPNAPSGFNHEGIHYAAQTFNDTPDGRRIQLGWGIVFAPGMPFNQMITFPTELSLRTTNEGIRMFCEPIKEIKTIHKKEHKLTDIKMSGTNKKDLLPEIEGELGELLHIKAEFEIGPTKSYGVFGFVINGYKIEYDYRHNRLNDAFLDVEDGKIYLEILVDRTSVEVFANHGRLYLADTHFSVDSPKQLDLFSLWRSPVLLSSLEIYELESIWE